jgi:hypothetical protein
MAIMKESIDYVVDVNRVELAFAMSAVRRPRLEAFTHILTSTDNLDCTVGECLSHDRRDQPSR